MTDDPRPRGWAILWALNKLGKPMYLGTVPAHVKAKRRTLNKAARISRRRNRR